MTGLKYFGFKISWNPSHIYATIFPTHAHKPGNTVALFTICFIVERPISLSDSFHGYTGISSSPAWLIVAGVFDVLSLMFGVTCIVCLSVCIFKPQLLPRTRRWPLVILTIFAFVEAALQQISCAVFLKQVHDSPQATPPFPENAFASLSWGAAFSVLGVILYAVVCILLFTDLVRICFAVPK